MVRLTISSSHGWSGGPYFGQLWLQTIPESAPVSMASSLASGLITISRSGTFSLNCVGNCWFRPWCRILVMAMDGNGSRVGAGFRGVDFGIWTRFNWRLWLDNQGVVLFLPMLDGPKSSQLFWNPLIFISKSCNGEYVEAVGESWNCQSFFHDNQSIIFIFLSFKDQHKRTISKKNKK